MFALLLAVMMALVLGYATKAYAAPGDLDPSFDTDGKVTTHFGSDNDEGRALALQEDGKIVVAGQAYTATTDRDFALARYNPDGSLDATFHRDGTVTTPIGSGSSPDYAHAVAVRPDGKIVVAGQASNGSNDDFAIARYNTDGSLDTNADADPAVHFDTDGKVTTDISGNDVVHDAVVQEDGKIVVAGRAFNGNNNDFAVARYNPNGSLDTTFGSDLDLQGVVKTNFSGFHDEAFGLALQDDGRMVLAGGSGGDFALARLNSDGSPNASFDTDGKQKTDFFGSTDAALGGVAVQEDGKIVAAGYAHNGSNQDFAVARYFGGNDTTPPNVEPPVQNFISGSTLKNTTTPNNVPIRVSWSATDSEGLISDYDLQRSMDGGAYQYVNLPSATATTVTHFLSPTHNYCYRVMATDDNGNVSDWSYGPAFTVDAHQESSTAIAYSGTWKAKSITSAYGGAVKYAKAAGATATLTFTGRNVAWVAPKRKTGGQAEVYLDGVKVQTADLYSSNARARKVVFSANGLDPTVTHTLEVKVLGTKRAASSSTRVDVDAFVVLR
jgi:uncharacterized delta-60 repeat protein